MGTVSVALFKIIFFVINFFHKEKTATQTFVINYRKKTWRIFNYISLIIAINRYTVVKLNYIF